MGGVFPKKKIINITSRPYKIKPRIQTFIVIKLICYILFHRIAFSKISKILTDFQLPILHSP